MTTVHKKTKQKHQNITTAADGVSNRHTVPEDLSKPTPGEQFSVCLLFNVALKNILLIQGKGWNLIVPHSLCHEARFLT